MVSGSSLLDVTSVVRIYAAVLLCRRLLRALVAAAASSAVLFALLIFVAVTISFVAALRSLVGDRPG